MCDCSKRQEVQSVAPVLWFVLCVITIICFHTGETVPSAPLGDITVDNNNNNNNLQSPAVRCEWCVDRCAVACVPVCMRRLRWRAVLSCTAEVSRHSAPHEPIKEHAVLISYLNSFTSRRFLHLQHEAGGRGDAQPH